MQKIFSFNKIMVEKIKWLLNESMIFKRVYNMNFEQVKINQLASSDFIYFTAINNQIRLLT